MVHSKLRFTLHSVLFLVLCIAGYLSGFRGGYQEGYRLGNEDHRRETEIVLATHDLAGVCGKSGRLSEFKIGEFLFRSVAPTTWSEVGGPATLNLFYDDHDEPFLVIAQTAAAHDDIRAFLDGLRGSRLDERLFLQKPAKACFEE